MAKIYAMLDCPVCKKKWHKSYKIEENAYCRTFYFNCPDCKREFCQSEPFSKQHRRGLKLRMKIHME